MPPGWPRTGPYWLGNVLALYDRETRMWLDKITDVELVKAAYRANRKLPPPETLGLAVLEDE